MYFGIGFLFASLIGIAVIPLVHARAVRLTLKRVENSIPQSMAEIQADKDLLRAEFAMQARRLEIDVEQLKDKAANQFAELGRKTDVINRLKIQHEAQNVETVALKTELDALKKEVGRRDVPAVAYQRHDPDVVSLVPNKDWPRSAPIELPQAAMLDAPQRHALVGFAELSCVARVHRKTIGATVDLRDADLDQLAQFRIKAGLVDI